MKVKDLRGKEYQWKLRSRPTSLQKSSYHLAARELLQKKYPCSIILEEVHLPGIGLYADFYLPDRKTIIEVHGDQHYNRNSHFHKSHKDFINQQQRDQDKTAWCQINNIRLIVLDFREKDDWLKKLC